MPARVRSRDLRAAISGRYLNHVFHTDVSRTASVGVREECEDVVGNRDFDNTLYVRRRENFTPRLSGREYADGFLIRELIGLPIDRHDINPENSYLIHYGDVLLSQIAQEIAGRTNPSKGSSNLLQSIGELRDVPGLWESWYSIGADILPWLHSRLRFTRYTKSIPASWRGIGLLRALPLYIWFYGRYCLQIAANLNLTWRFALRPMYHDLIGMLSFMDSVHRRMAYLQRLERGGYERRRVMLDSDYSSQDEDLILHTLGCTVTGTRHTYWILRQWGTCRWSSGFTGSWPETSLRKHLTNWWVSGPRIGVGLNEWGAIKAWWELIPWSWLVEWFSDVSSFLETHDNAYPGRISNICFMRDMIAKSEYRISNKPDWVQITGDFSESEERKYRIPLGNELLLYPPLPLLPILNSAQWSILGSLAVLKGIGPNARLPIDSTYHTKVGKSKVSHKFRPGSVKGL